MKKRIIILYSLISLLSLLILFIISLVIISNENQNKAEEEIRIYLEVASDYYVNNNYEEVATYMEELNSNLRITFIDTSGYVIYDSILEYNVSGLDNHLAREEIANLGSIAIRKSSSTNDRLIYIATLKDNTYIRISFPTITFTTANIVYAILSILVICIIVIIEFFVLFFISKKMIKPIDSKINELAKLTDYNVTFKTDSIDNIPGVIDSVNNLLDKRINEIKEENIKNETIIQNIDECLILLKDTTITLLNDKTLEVFKVSKDKVLNQNYIYLFRQSSLLDAISEGIINKKSSNFNIVIDNRTYDTSIIPFNSTQLLISLKDITEKERMEVVKKDFFANASHELKSPLTSIIGYQQMILEGIIDNKDEIKDASQKILKEANRMNQIIIDMLELSNLEFNRDYDQKEEDITSLLNEVIKSYQAKIKAKKINLLLNINDVKLKCNKDQLETLFSNLLDNAIKYNKVNGMIEVILNDKEFIVKDSGIGIPKESIDRVFERFYRVDKAKSKDSGGTGLGLAIVKHICEKFNYKISLESSLDVGTTITIKF